MVGLVPCPNPPVVFAGQRTLPVPRMIATAGPHATRRFVGLVTANIRNPNTRAAYATAVNQFLGWCDGHRLSLGELEPVAVSAYVEHLMLSRSAPTVKQHLAAIGVLFDWLVVGQVIPMNPAASVRGPRHVVRRGKAMVLSAGQASTCSTRSTRRRSSACGTGS